MSQRSLLKAFGLKWNPFARDLPTEALVVSPQVEHFAWRVERLVDEGGFAMITGEPGTGKSAAMRILHHRLCQVRDGTVAHVDRPQSSVADFYRELGDAFGVKVGASNRWGGFKTLRERWRATLESTLVRPVLLIDEAQEIAPVVLSEVRILSAESFDSKSLLTVIFAGDSRLPVQLRSPELLPLESRIRARLILQTKSNDELIAALRTLTEQAGNPRLMTEELMDVLALHSHGNFRSLMNLANELLLEGHARGTDRLDEKLYFELDPSHTPAPPRAIDGGRKAKARRR
jgi:type II secretory pathway predicted ATPase ExeA